ncbi:MAG TPA: hypothetical protein VIK69_11805 [Methylophilaceae bacterium]
MPEPAQWLSITPAVARRGETSCCGASYPQRTAGRDTNAEQSMGCGCTNRQRWIVQQMCGLGFRLACERAKARLARMEQAEREKAEKRRAEREAKNASTRNPQA